MTSNLAEEETGALKRRPYSRRHRRDESKSKPGALKRRLYCAAERLAGCGIVEGYSGRIVRACSGARLCGLRKLKGSKVESLKG
jgi:hypothetical protein